MTIKTIVAFCGSGDGYNGIFKEIAWELGAYLADKGIRLVYGGTKIGLMGALADGVLNNGGEAIGVLPRFLQTKEIAHEGLTQMISVDTMHDRKMRMHELSDAILALPGGWGTMEELFEMMTWAQLGLHSKPVGILNINHFYDPLLAQLSVMTEEGFLQEKYKNMIQVSEDYIELLDKMNHYDPPPSRKWITKETT